MNENMRPVKVVQAPGRNWPATAAVVVATALAWLAWLGWNTERTTDPVTGNTTGPYEAWQVAGCGITLLVIAVWGAWRLDLKTLVVALPATFTAVWSIWAVRSDDSGLWAVGALLLGGALVIGTLLTHALTDSVHKRRRKARSRGTARPGVGG